MSVEKYRTFTVVAHCNTFIQAAQALDITPATVSKHIASLEREVGTKLFDRTSSGIRLTKAGETRLPFATRLVEAYHSLFNEMDEKTLLLFTTPPPSRFGLSEILSRFKALAPDVTIEIVEKRETPEMIENQECELGFFGNKHKVSPKLECINVNSTRIGAILPVSHSLADRESISLSELEEDDFILPAPEVHVYRVYTQCCQKCGFTPKVKQTAYRDDSVLFYVANKQGVSLYTQEMLSTYNFPGLVFVPLKEEFYSGGALAKRRDAVLSTPANAFWEFIKETYQA